MNAAYEIGINLISAAIGAGIGLFWTFGKNTLKYRRQRAFWRFLEKPTILVVGDLTPEVLLETLADSLEDMADTQQGRQHCPKVFGLMAPGVRFLADGNELGAG